MSNSTKTTLVLVNLGVPEPMKSLRNSAKYGTKENQVPANLSFEVDGKTYSIPVNVGLGFDTDKSQGYFSLEDAKGFISESEAFDGESFAKFVKTNLSVEREARNKSTDALDAAFGFEAKPKVNKSSRPKLVDGKLNADAKLYFSMAFKYLKGNPLPVNSNLSYGSLDALIKGIEAGEVKVAEHSEYRYSEPTAIFPNDPEVKVWNRYKLVLKVERKPKAETK